MNLMSSPHKIVRRVCNSCHIAEFKEIYYKRLTGYFTRKVLQGMINGPFDQTTENLPIRDFTLHSTYKDAIEGTNSWSHVSIGSRGFPGSSGRSSSNQCNIEKQFNGGNDGQPDFAFYIEESAWIPMVGYGHFNINGNRNGEIISETYLSNALQALHDSGSGIVRMICYDCEVGFKDLYYQRITAAPDDLLTTLLYDFKEKKGNILNRDFKIFSSYSNALNSTDAWEVCESSTKKMGFPANCKPDTSWTTPVRFFRALPEKIYARHESSTNRHIGFYIEDNHLPDTGAWMSESDEMKAFLNPESNLEKDHEITCHSEKFNDGSLQDKHVFTDSLQPYILQGAADSYAGWYDLQGCGKCNDWCGWFAPPGTTTFDGGNPYYNSWSDSDHVFACVTGDSDLTSNSLLTNGIDSTAVTSSIYSDSDNKYRFFPSAFTKCNVENEEAPSSHPLYQYVGCYKDAYGDKQSRTLPILGSSSMSLEACYHKCKSMGKHFFGRQATQECWCGGADKDTKQYAKYGDSSACSCESSSLIGHNVNCVYQINDYITPAPTLSPTSTPPVPSNVARLGVASQKDTWSDYGWAYLAIDGNLDQTWDGRSVTHTTASTNPWWKVQLDKAYQISSIKIYNRSDIDGDCCRERILGFVLKILKEGTVVYDSSVVDPSKSSNTRLIYTYPIPDIVGDEVRVDIPAPNKIVSLAEVLIMGVADPGPAPSYSPTKMLSQQPSAAPITCSSIVEKLTQSFPPLEKPIALSVPKPGIDDFAGYYDVQRCGTCNDWCGWVGTNIDVSPPNPWFKTATDSHYFTCKLAAGYSSAYGITEKGYFGESFPYQKCSGKGADTPAYRKVEYVGCYKATSHKSLFAQTIGNRMKIPFYDCADTCKAKGYHYFGRQAVGQCRCGGNSASDDLYAKEGQIFSSDNNYCGDCIGSNIGAKKNCVFQITDQYDPEQERKKHACSHISLMDVRRYCYVSCRDKDKNIANMATCTSLTAMGLVELNNEISGWTDSPLCDTKDCQKKYASVG